MHLRSNTVTLSVLAAVAALAPTAAAQTIGREVAVPRHLADGQEFRIPLRRLVEHGELLFTANWTGQEGGGRPLTKGTGAPLSDPNSPLLFPRNFNRLSAPDANSCAGCHNAPFGIPGGGGDVVTNVFVLAQRFDCASFDHADPTPTRGAVAENGAFATLDDIGNSRATLGMFGSGYIEMLARQITADLQAIRDTIAPGSSAALVSKGISFGTLARNPDATWDTAGVEGLPAPSIASTSATDPPNLIVRPFHQAGAVISLRQFTNNAMNHHHGIQAVERFGPGDPDNDGYTNEMTTADVTAATVFQAVMAPPGRVLPTDPMLRAAVAVGEARFAAIGCADCHIPSLPLDDGGWVYTEPNPYNPSGNLQPQSAYVQAHGTFAVDLNDPSLPGPRLPRTADGVVHVPAFTDFKLHDITSGPADPNREPLDMHAAAGTPAFFAGNGKFLTRKLWGIANEAPYYHHGKYTTIRQAVEAHAGEASAVMQRYFALPQLEQDSIIEFLKTLQVLRPAEVRCQALSFDCGCIPAAASLREEAAHRAVAPLRSPTRRTRRATAPLRRGARSRS